MATVQLVLSDIDPSEIVMAHIHCEKPGMLGPNFVDFGTTEAVDEYLADGVLTCEITNRDLGQVIEYGDGIVAAITAGCPILVVRRLAGSRTATAVA